MKYLVSILLVLSIVFIPGTDACAYTYYVPTEVTPDPDSILGRMAIEAEKERARREARGEKVEEDTPEKPGASVYMTPPLEQVPLTESISPSDSTIEAEDDTEKQLTIDDVSIGYYVKNNISYYVTGVISLCLLCVAVYLILSLCAFFVAKVAKSQPDEVLRRKKKWRRVLLRSIVFCVVLEAVFYLISCVRIFYEMKSIFG